MDVNGGSFNDKLKKVVRIGIKHVRQCMVSNDRMVRGGGVVVDRLSSLTDWDISDTCLIRPPCNIIKTNQHGHAPMIIIQ